VRVHTIEEARALVGRGFKDPKGLIRIVDRIENLRTSLQGSGNVIGEVYWRRPGKEPGSKGQWLPYFNDWLARTEEVEVASGKTDNEESAELIVDALIIDLCGRSGLENEWDAIDEDIKKEIRLEWKGIVDSILRRSRVR